MITFSEFNAAIACYKLEPTDMDASKMEHQGTTYVVQPVVIIQPTLFTQLIGAVTFLKRLGEADYQALSQIQITESGSLGQGQVKSWLIEQILLVHSHQPVAARD